MSSRKSPRAPGEPSEKQWLEWQFEYFGEIDLVIDLARSGVLGGSSHAIVIDQAKLGHGIYLDHVEPAIAWLMEKGRTRKDATAYYVKRILHCRLRAGSESQALNAIAEAMMKQAYTAAALAALSRTYANFAAAGHALYQMVELGGASIDSTRARTLEKKQRVAGATEESKRQRAAKSAALREEVTRAAQKLLQQGVPEHAINKTLSKIFARSDLWKRTAGPTPQYIGKLRRKQF
ncbi:MAG: hypothetical protein GEV05_28275 [Betaproteobacteria bacterium]|nr:hypothetical protein [Betaproteobacteria bacterium]